LPVASYIALAIAGATPHRAIVRRHDKLPP
jgi:hypothetical protein